jgi:hypothetical protein
LTTTQLQKKVTGTSLGTIYDLVPGTNVANNESVVVHILKPDTIIILLLLLLKINSILTILEHKFKEVETRNAFYFDVCRTANRDIVL